MKGSIHLFLYITIPKNTATANTSMIFHHMRDKVKQLQETIHFKEKTLSPKAPLIPRMKTTRDFFASYTLKPA